MLTTNAVNPYNVDTVTTKRDKQMAKYTTTKNTDGLWDVTDELGSVLGTEDTRKKAQELVRELKKQDAANTNVHHIPGTAYGNDPIPEVNDEVVNEPIPVVNDEVVNEPIPVVNDEVVPVVNDEPIPEVVVEVVNEPIPEEEPLIKPTAMVVIKPANTEVKKVSKGQQCRDYIAGVKKNGGTKEEVIAFGIEVLGFKRPLAKKYMEENWVRVPD